LRTLARRFQVERATAIEVAIHDRGLPGHCHRATGGRRSRWAVTKVRRPEASSDLRNARVRSSSPRRTPCSTSATDSVEHEIPPVVARFTRCCSTALCRSPLLRCRCCEKRAPSFFSIQKKVSGSDN
jgi:hypothetical protein